jgi:hypothetical protein
MNFCFARPISFGLGLLAASLFILHTSLPNAAPAVTINSVSVLPNPIPANIPVTITVSAEITSDPIYPIGAGVYRVNEGPQPPSFLGSLQLDKSVTQSGQPIHYAVQTTLNIPPGQTQLQVSAIGAGQTITSPLIKVLALPTPVNYVVDTNLLAAGGPLNFNNFNSKYIRGGFTPIGGAQIGILSKPLPSAPLIDYIKKELPETKFVASTLTTAAGFSCSQVAFTDVEKLVIVYCPSGNTLFRFSLRYRADDSARESSFLSTFQQVIDGAKLAP